MDSNVCEITLLRSQRTPDLGSSVYPADEELLGAVDKFLQGGATRSYSGGEFPPSQDSLRSLRSFSPGTPTPRVHFHTRLSHDARTTDSSESGYARTLHSDESRSHSESLLSSSSSPSEPESAYFGDDSDTSERQRLGDGPTHALSDLTEDDSYASCIESSPSAGDDDDASAPTGHSSRSRTVRSTCVTAPAAKVGGGGSGGDHNYSLASRCRERHHHKHHHHQQQQHHRRNPWRKAREGFVRDDY